MTQHMWQSPDPATAGSQVTIYYKLHPNITYPFTLTVLGQPCGSVQEYQINDIGDLIFTVSLPAKCEGGTIEDSSGESEDFAIAIS